MNVLLVFEVIVVLLHGLVFFTTYSKDEKTKMSISLLEEENGL